jgi:hypothetical protein
MFDAALCSMHLAANMQVHAALWYGRALFIFAV